VHQLKPLQQHSKGSLSSMRELEVIFHLYQQAFQEISKLPRIFMTVAVTTAQAEWSSSKLCVVKPYLRNRMSSQRISNLAILAIEQDRADCLDIDIFVNKFVTVRSNRREFIRRNRLLNDLFLFASLHD